MIHADHHIRPVSPHGRREDAAQRQPVFEHSVQEAEKLHLFDADHRGGCAFLGLAQRAGLLGCHRVDAGLPAGGQAVGDVLALAGPASHGRGRAIFQVVWMGHDRQRPTPFLGNRLQWIGLCGHRAPLRVVVAEGRLCPVSGRSSQSSQDGPLPAA